MVSTDGLTAVGGRVFFNHLVWCHCVHVSLYARGLFVLLMVIAWSGVLVYWCHCVHVSLFA